MYCVLLTLLQVDVRVKRYLTKDLPETDEGVAQWCRDLFTDKVHATHVLDCCVPKSILLYKLLHMLVPKCPTNSCGCVGFNVCRFSSGNCLAVCVWPIRMQCWTNI